MKVGLFTGASIFPGICYGLYHTEQSNLSFADKVQMLAETIASKEANKVHNNLFYMYIDLLWQSHAFNPYVPSIGRDLKQLEVYQYNPEEVNDYNGRNVLQLSWEEPGKFSELSFSVVGQYDSSGHWLGPKIVERYRVGLNSHERLVEPMELADAMDIFKRFGLHADTPFGIVHYQSYLGGGPDNLYYVMEYGDINTYYEDLGPTLGYTGSVNPFRTSGSGDETGSQTTRLNSQGWYETSQGFEKLLQARSANPFSIGNIHDLVSQLYSN